MSLWSPYAFDALGNAPAGPTSPPVLRVEGAPASAAQLAAAQQVFAIFAQERRFSFVPNPTQSGALADGSTYKISTVGVQTFMQLWPAARTANKSSSGILVLYQDVGHFIIRYDQSWSATPVASGYFGSNVNRALSGDTYFLDMMDLTNVEGQARPTKFNGLVRSENRGPISALVFNRAGYLFEPKFEGGIKRGWRSDCT